MYFDELVFSIILIVFASIAVLALLIWIDYLIAREFYRAACLKGHKEKKYLWISFFLFVVGYLLVIALPDLSKADKNKLSDKSHNGQNNKQKQKPKKNKQKEIKRNYDDEDDDDYEDDDSDKGNSNVLTELLYDKDGFYSEKFVDFVCPNCSAELSYPEEYLSENTVIACPQCKTKIKTKNII